MLLNRTTKTIYRQWPAVRNTAALFGVFCAIHTATASDTPIQPSAESWKPAWLTDVSVTIKESYDDNVFMSGVNQSEVPAGTTTLKDQSSFITTISPKVGVNLARTFDTSGNLSVLSLTYAPDIVVYHELPSENYDAHRLLLAVRGKDDAFSYSLDNTLVYVEASTLAPTYPGNLLNAWATINDWQRREQLNDRSKVSLQYDWDKWFIRPGASLAYYGMMTQIKDVEGYQNYPTRYDVNGGADVGYKFCTNMAATLGYRYGSQGQQQFSFSPYSSPSDYQRVLLGVEGKPLSWLSIQMLGGPDFRSYAGDTATHITPVNDLHMTTYYGESTIAATLTPDDMLSFKYKQFQFVSSCGKVPYFDSSYALCYDRKITDRLSVEVGPRLLEADYNSGNLSSSSSKRDDLDYILSVGLHYVFSANIAADLSYSASLGRNAEANIANSQTRDFDAQDVSLGVQFKY